MKNWFVSYFENPARISSGQRTTAVILSVLLFFALAFMGYLLTLNRTIFNSNYAASYVDEIDVPASVEVWLEENVPPEDALIAGAVHLGVTYFEPEIKDQMRNIVRQLHRTLMQALIDTDLNAVAGQREQVIDVAANISNVVNLPLLDPLWESLGIPPGTDVFTINVDEINSAFDVIEELAERQNLASFAYRLYVPSILIVAMLVIAIIFVARRFGLITGILGITFVAYGIIELISMLPIVSYLRDSVRDLQLNEVVNDASLRLVSDIHQISNIFGGVVLFLGLLLIVAYYVSKSRKTTFST